MIKEKALYRGGTRYEDSNYCGLTLNYLQDYFNVLIAHSQVDLPMRKSIKPV